MLEFPTLIILMDSIVFMVLHKKIGGIWKLEVWDWNNQYSFKDQGISFLEDAENLRLPHVHIFMSLFVTWKQNNLRLKLHNVTWLSATIYAVWIGNWNYWTLTYLWLQAIITVSLIHTLYSPLQHTLKSSQHAVSSPFFWLRLPAADVLLPLGSRTVPLASATSF
jgi:hypothetical protein